MQNSQKDLQKISVSFRLNVDITRKKRCDKCKEEKGFIEFSKAIKRKDGKQRSCKQCNQQYREENKEHYRKYAKEYNIKNKEYFKVYRTQYRKNNYEKVSARERKYNNTHREFRQLRKRQYYQRNKNIIHAKARERYRTNPLFKLRSNIASAIKRAFSTRQLNKNYRPSFDLLGYSVKFLQEHLKQYINQSCERCGKIILTFENSEIEHIIPIVLAKTEEDIIELSHYSNLRLLCPHCNQCKNGLLDFDNAIINKDLYNKFVEPQLEKQNE